MPYREVGMPETEEVLRLCLGGVPKKRIARQLGLDSEDGGHYVQEGENSGLSLSQGPAAPTEEGLATVLAALRILGLEKIIGDDRFRALDLAGRHILLLFLLGASTDDRETSGGTIPSHDGSGRLHLAAHGRPQPLLPGPGRPPAGAGHAGPVAGALRRGPGNAGRAPGAAGPQRADDLQQLRGDPPDAGDDGESGWRADG